MQRVSDQSDVIELLSNPATHGVQSVERIDTHASTVFLAGTRALKLKRAVKYDYLDYSTADLRRRCCEAEIRINARMAPALYRRVVPVVRTRSGALTLGGEGMPVDWVVEMTRFDQDALFDRLAASGRLDLALMAPLAEEVAAVHASGTVREEFGGASGIARVVDGNALGCRQYGRDCFGLTACDSLVTASRVALRGCAGLLDRRRETGYVRECHGDLHLGNIVLIDGRPTLFDAIEFNHDIACIDVAYDLAFLLMDLWHRGLHLHANTVLNAYLGETHDFEGLTALPLFLSCRAAVRAKTSAAAALLQALPERQHMLQADARDYLNLATRLLPRAAPVIVAISGLSGSGKSTVARLVAPSVGAVPGAVVVRSDQVRKRLCGVSPLTKLGPAGYTREVSARVYEAMIADAAAVVQNGHAVIVDAVFARAEDRLALERAARAAGVAFAAVWLDATEPVLVDRVKRRGPDVSDADVAVVRMQCAQWADDVRWPHVNGAADESAVLADVRAQLQAQTVALDVAA